jgi:hypothetical protein
MHFVLHISCLNEYNFSILSSKFCSDSISKRKLIIIYVSIRSRNETLRFIQAALCTKEKSMQQRFIFQLCKGKRERIICFFMIKSKKRIAFVHQKMKLVVNGLKGHKNAEKWPSKKVDLNKNPRCATLQQHVHCKQIIFLRICSSS